MQVATGVSLFTYTRWHGSPVSVQQVIRTRSSLQHQRAQSDELRRKLKNESCSVSAPNAFESSVWATSLLPSAPARMCAVAVLVVRNRLSQLPTFSRSSPQNCSHTPCCSVGHLTKTESSACAWIGVLTLLQVHHSRCLGECIPPRPPQVPYLITTTSNNNSTNSNNTDPSMCALALWQPQYCLVGCQTDFRVFQPLRIITSQHQEQTNASARRSESQPCFDFHHSPEYGERFQHILVPSVYSSIVLAPNSVVRLSVPAGSMGTHTVLCSANTVRE